MKSDHLSQWRAAGFDFNLRASKIMVCVWRWAALFPRSQRRFKRQSFHSCCRKEENGGWGFCSGRWIRQTSAAFGSFLEDDGMIYHPEYLNRFFASPGACAFGAFEGKRPVGMAYCYLLPRPDGKTMFFCIRWAFCLLGRIGESVRSSWHGCLITPKIWDARSCLSLRTKEIRARAGFMKRPVEKANIQMRLSM